MIRFIYAEDLAQMPKLRDTMFRDRATQFKTRLNWEVTVDSTGFEVDQYDTMNPMYAIWEMPDGTHGGSMRFLPTMGQTMVNDHFLDLTDGVRIQHPLIWECTRFCLSPHHPDAAAGIAGGLMAAGCEIGLQYGLSDWVGVFDPRMVRIYRRIGWEPTVLGEKGEGKDRIAVGLWQVSDAARDAICLKSGIASTEPEAWFNASFSAPVSSEVAA